MSETFGRTFSGGLTVEDLRDAWLMLEQTFPRNRIPQDLVDRLRRDWRRSDQGVRSVLATLKKMHRGGERGSDKSTLWDLTEAERWYVFTGQQRHEQAQPALPLEVGGVLVGEAVERMISELVDEARLTNELLCNLIALYRSPAVVTGSDGVTYPIPAEALS